MPTLGGEVIGKDISKLIDTPPSAQVLIPNSAVAIYGNKPISQDRSKIVYRFMAKAGIDPSRQNTYNPDSHLYISVRDMSELDLLFFGERFSRRRNQATLETKWALQRMARDTRMEWFGSFIQADALLMLSELATMLRPTS